MRQVHESMGEFQAPPTSPVTMPDTFELEEEMHLPGKAPLQSYLKKIKSKSTINIV